MVVDFVSGTANPTKMNYPASKPLTHSTGMIRLPTQHDEENQLLLGSNILSPLPVTCLCISPSNSCIRLLCLTGQGPQGAQSWLILVTTKREQIQCQHVGT